MYIPRDHTHTLQLMFFKLIVVTLNEQLLRFLPVLRVHKYKTSLIHPSQLERRSRNT